MAYLSNLLFLIVFAAAVVFFSRNVATIVRNIKMGRPLNRSDRKGDRWRVMARVALGQSKMVARPVAGFLHLLIYAGFIIINIEVLEIIVDGIFGTHRVLSFMGGFYYFLIDAFEVLAVLVLVACLGFLARRNIQRIGRFHKPEMKGWPSNDANLILIWECVLMAAFLFMDAADGILMQLPAEALAAEGLEKYALGFDRYFVVSGWLTGLLPDSPASLAMIERTCWWVHIVGILGFLNYLPYSKHFHVILAFPNTWYSNLEPLGRFDNMASVKEQVELMMDPNADPYGAPAAEGEPAPFGAKDVTDLSWKQLMDAYSCTECGRCTSECPANLTGKLLSPRKIVMDVRDRTHELGAHKAKNGADSTDGKSLLSDYITPEELWACTSCNACTQACPVNIDPLSVIIDLRRHLVMEQSAAPAELNTTFTNIENNGAPWQFAQADRLKWASEE